jgi:hypothetical protein
VHASDEQRDAAHHGDDDSDRLQRKRPLSIGGCLKCADVDNGLCRRVDNAAIPVVFHHSAHLSDPPMI